jgi:hypothetical protein
MPQPENVELLRISRIDELNESRGRSNHEISTHEESPKIPYVGCLGLPSRVVLTHDTNVEY